MKRFAAYFFAVVTIAFVSSPLSSLAQIASTRAVAVSSGADMAFVTNAVAAPDAIVVTPNVAAPSLTRVFVANVCSATVGCETIASGQGVTKLVHGGAYIDVYVWEIGYGTGEIAKQGGNQLGNPYLVSYNGVCVNGNSYTITCPVGSVYVGWRYEWNVAYYVENNFGNYFTAQDTSQIYPFSTFSTFLTIQH